MGDHFSIVNDIASYEKEYENFKNGKAQHLVNIVVVMQEIYQSTSSDDAKTKSYALQLDTEDKIVQELESMKEARSLSLSEWDYVDAVLAMAAGNIFTSVVISRYGGEAARIRDKVTTQTT